MSTAVALVVARPYVVEQTRSPEYAVRCRAWQVMSHIDSELRRIPLTDNDCPQRSAEAPRPPA